MKTGLGRRIRLSLAVLGLLVAGLGVTSARAAEVVNLGHTVEGADVGASYIVAGMDACKVQGIGAVTWDNNTAGVVGYGSFPSLGICVFTLASPLVLPIIEGAELGGLVGDDGPVVAPAPAEWWPVDQVREG
jgi:hypothetical protein